MMAPRFQIKTISVLAIAILAPSSISSAKKKNPSADPTPESDGVGVNRDPNKTGGGGIPVEPQSSAEAEFTRMESVLVGREAVEEEDSQGGDHMFRPIAVVVLTNRLDDKGKVFVGPVFPSSSLSTAPSSGATFLYLLLFIYVYVFTSPCSGVALPFPLRRLRVPYILLFIYFFICVCTNICLGFVPPLHCDVFGCHTLYC